MTGTETRSTTWTVAPEEVASADALVLLREYFTEVSDRYYQLHFDRRSTPEEIETGLAGSPSDYLAPPTGVFLLGRYGGRPAACAGVHVLSPGTVELKRMYVRPALRGTGGARRLLDAVDAAARKLGARRIVLDTRLDLTEARALYVRNGWVEVPAYNDNRYAEIWYARELGAPPSADARELGAPPSADARELGAPPAGHGERAGAPADRHTDPADGR